VSTAPTFDIAAALAAREAADARVKAAEERKAQLAAEAKRADPFASYVPLPHQLAFHRATQKERWFVAGNRAGKTVAGAAEVVALVTGRMGERTWWHKAPGEVWCGGVSLQDSEMIQRRAVRALLPPSMIASWPNETNPAAESLLTLTTGWRVRFKATNQGRERWQGGSAALVWFDEEPAPDVYDEGVTRTLDCGGRVIVTFTPLNGLKWEDGYKRVYAPWLAFKRANPQATSGQVAPGIFVVTASMTDNPNVPREEIEAFAKRYEHRPLVLKVRIGGEWLNTAEDAIIPVDKLEPHAYDLQNPPQGGWARVAAWADSSFSKSQTSDRWCISLAASGHPTPERPGKLYLLEQDYGRLDADERVQRTVGFLLNAGQPTCYVQRTTPDTEFMHRVNDALMRRGARACVTPWPPLGGGPVPGKVERAHAFAVMVGAKQVHVRDDHEEFKREASTFPHAKHDDVLDSGMGALMILTEMAAPAALISAVAQSGAFSKRPADHHVPKDDTTAPHWAWGGGRDLLDEVD
jgi:phage terminase large subunit-like protein